MNIFSVTIPSEPIRSDQHDFFLFSFLIFLTRMCNCLFAYCFVSVCLVFVEHLRHPKFLYFQVFVGIDNVGFVICPEAWQTCEASGAFGLKTTRKQLLKPQTGQTSKQFISFCCLLRLEFSNEVLLGAPL